MSQTFTECWNERQLDQIFTELDHALNTLLAESLFPATSSPASYTRMVEEWLQQIQYLITIHPNSDASAIVGKLPLMNEDRYSLLCRLSCLPSGRSKALVYRLLCEFCTRFPRLLSMMCSNQLVGRDMHQPGSASSVAIRTLGGIVKRMCAAINSSTNQTVSAVMEDLHQCYSGFRASLVPALLHTLASESILSKLNACLTLISSVNSDNLTVAECQSLFACLSGLAERAIAAVTKMTTGFPSATDAEITLLACQLRALFHLQKYFNSVEQPIAAKLTVSSSSWLRLILRCFDMSMAGESCCPLGEPQLTQEQSAVQLCLAGDDSGGRGIDWDDEILRQALFQLAEFAMDRLLCAADTLDNRMALLNIFDDWLVRNRLSAESSQLLQSSYLKVLVMLERLAPSLVEFSQLVGRFCELLLSNQAAGSVPYGFLRFVERQYLSNNRGEMANILPILKNNLPSLLCLSTDSLLVKSEKIRLLTKLTIAIDTVDIAFLICKQLWDYTLDPELAAIAIKALTEIAIDSDAGQMEYAKDASIRMWIIEQFTGQLFADNPHLRNLIYGLCSIGASVPLNIFDQTLMLAIIRFVVDNYENSDCSPLLDALIEWLFVNHDSGSGDCLLYLSAMLKYGGDLLSSRLGYFNLSRAIDIQAINRLEKSIMPPSPSSLDKFQQSFLKRRLQTRRAS